MFKELEMFSLEKRRYMEKQNLFSDTQIHSCSSTVPKGQVPEQ